MLLGMIYKQQEKYDKAKEIYEEALTIDPEFAPAANSLAWIYAEHGGTIDGRSPWPRRPPYHPGMRSEERRVGKECRL